MKELSIEEKAKAYDEALENAKYYHSEMGDDVKCVLEEVFPVLNESDDDRIREQILDYFMAKKINESQPILDSWIAWLKKQRDPFVKWNNNTDDNKPQINHSILMKTTHGIAEGEWDGEYWIQYRWSSLVKDEDVLSWIELFKLNDQD